MLASDARRTDSVERFRLEERRRSGARWFYWVAALSLFTSVSQLAGGGWGFVISLGATQVIDALALGLAEGVGPAIKAVAFALDLTIIGAFALAGHFAGRGSAWAFAAGMAAYALDALIFIALRQWLGLAFHAFALYGMFSGYRACLKLNAASRRPDARPVPFADEAAEAPATP
jgi:hypothetical protein